MISRKIRSAYQCKLTVLSPVHIGCGRKYIKHFDFIEESGKLKVFSHNRLFSLIQDRGLEVINAFSAALESNTLAEFIRDNKINISDALLQTYSVRQGQKPPTEISRYIHDGAGQPIIPGSSLKGVFRTAILSRLAEEDEQHITTKEIAKIRPGNRVNSKFADQQICAQLLGKDAKLNLMRSLTAADFKFQLKSAKIEEACVNRLTGPSVFSRKNWSVFVEGLRQGESATGQISFDEYLQDEAEGKEMFDFKTRLSCNWLIEALRMRTRKFLEKENAFLHDKSGFGITEMRQFYTWLDKENQQLEDNEAIIQFAWGSGWKGMTGELINDDQLTNDLRNTLQLAPRYQTFPFPKSRRLSVSDQAIEPFGWVKLSFEEKDKAIEKLKRSVKSPKEKFLEDLDKAKDWGQLLQLKLDEEAKIPWLSESMTGQAVKTAAMKIYDNYSKNWDKDRDAQVLAWLRHSGVEWEPKSKEEPEVTPLPASSMLKTISTLPSLEAYRDSGIKIHQLDKQSAEALKVKFSEWGITKKAKGKWHSSEFKKLVRRLKQLS